MLNCNVYLENISVFFFFVFKCDTLYQEIKHIFLYKSCQNKSSMYKVQFKKYIETIGWNKTHF